VTAVVADAAQGQPTLAITNEPDLADGKPPP
jgi:hypothetical protein